MHSGTPGKACPPPYEGNGRVQGGRQDRKVNHVAKEQPEAWPRRVFDVDVVVKVDAGRHQRHENDPDLHGTDAGADFSEGVY